MFISSALSQAEMAVSMEDILAHQKKNGYFSASIGLPHPTLNL